MKRHFLPVLIFSVLFLFTFSLKTAKAQDCCNTESDCTPPPGYTAACTSLPSQECTGAGFKYECLYTLKEGCCLTWENCELRPGYDRKCSESDTCGTGLECVYSVTDKVCCGNADDCPVRDGYKATCDLYWPFACASEWACYYTPTDWLCCETADECPQEAGKVALCEVYSIFCNEKKLCSYVTPTPTPEPDCRCSHPCMAGQPESSCSDENPPTIWNSCPLECCTPEGCPAAPTIPPSGLPHIDFPSLIRVTLPESIFWNNATIGPIITILLPYIYGAAGLAMLLYLVLGAYQILVSSGDPKQMAAGREKITYAIVGFVIMFAAYWITRIAGEILDIQQIRDIFG